jgi:hypothetical protein
MDKNSNKIPKDGDILVLEKNRNIIYSYNGKGKSFNAFHVAVYVMGDDYDVTYSQSNNDVTAYDAPYDFATPDEIETFNKAIVTDDNDIVPFTESMIDLISDYLKINPDIATRLNMKRDFIKLLDKYSD